MYRASQEQVASALQAPQMRTEWERANQAPKSASMGVGEHALDRDSQQTKHATEWMTTVTARSTKTQGANARMETNVFAAQTSANVSQVHKFVQTANGVRVSERSPKKQRAVINSMMIVTDKPMRMVYVQRVKAAAPPIKTASPVESTIPA